ncbi:unnamed protein product [Calypogeia fissa]
MERSVSSERGAGRGDERDWLEEWRVHARLLRSALQSGAPDEETQKLLTDCFSQYSHYLSVCAASERRGSSRGTSLEAAFMWLGGWRPSCAVVMASSLLTAEGGVVSAVVNSNQSTYSLTREQLDLLEPLQKGIRQSELDLSQQLSLLQMLVADQSMLSALTIYSESSMSTATMKDLMEIKVVAVKGLFEQADKLRLQTLEDLWKLLTPVQAARASVAAFEFVFMMRSMGRNSTPMRSMSASEVTFEQSIVVDILPTVQNLLVPIHAGLQLEDSVRPVTLSFPIVPAPVLAGAVGIQSSFSTLPEVTPPNVEGTEIFHGP